MKGRVLLLRAGLMVLLSVMVGCNRNIVPSVTSEVSDSVHVRETTRFVEVRIPGDTVEVLRIIECDSITNKPKPFKLKKKAKRATVTVSVKSTGEMTATSECDSLKEKLSVTDKELFRLRHEKREETKPIVIYKVHTLDIVCRWISGIVLMILIGRAAFKYLKTTLPWKTS